MHTIDEVLAVSDQNKQIIALGDFVAAREDAAGYQNLTETEKYISGVYFYEAEVNNGGLDQYFFNSTGDRWKMTLAGLHKIGAHHAAEIFQNAVALFGPEGPAEEGIKRQNQLQQFSDADREKEEQLTDEFYKYEDNLSDLVTSYAKTHADDFGKT